MRIAPLVARAARIAIILLIALCVGELALFFILQGHAELYRADEPFPPPSGYLLDSHYMAAMRAPCYVLRISSDSCPDCWLDQQRYARLVGQAKEAQCETVITAPVAGEMKLDPNSPSLQLQYIDMNFGRVLKPFVTPETILLDARGRPVWQQQGAMNDNSLGLALHALERVH